MKKNSKSVQLAWIPRVVEEVLPNGQVVFVATHPDFPYVIAQGTTYQEARSEFKGMVWDVLSELKRSGATVPNPQDFIITVSTVGSGNVVSANTQQVPVIAF
jgi:predicted RNase H-like HicB family nuclease